MNRKITLLALAGSGASFAASGLDRAATASPASKQDAASPPNPRPARSKNWRREAATIACWLSMTVLNQRIRIR